VNRATATRAKITGERVMTSVGGFNPTWQRHAAAYEQCSALLPHGRVLDLGCGIGHSHHLLAPRETVGVDTDADALAGQGRPTRVADMRELPFADGEFGSVLAMQSLEHVPDPECVLAEARRVLEKPGGMAIFVTPNRLTFARPDEIIDPYHFVEFSADQLADLCGRFFEQVKLYGLFGSRRYLDLIVAEHRDLDRVLRTDPLRLRRMIPRRLRQRLYDWMLARTRSAEDSAAAAITREDFELRGEDVDESLDLIAVCINGVA
jgi:SAM-dependent methyltransferase